MTAWRLFWSGWASRPVQSYEKYRETYHWGDVEVVLDETPFGDFVELEGENETALKAVAAAFGARLVAARAG